MQATARHRTRRPPILLIVVVIAIIGSSMSVAQAENTGRPRIGLVLGGGGARGAAHIGVLKVLEELRVPIDCIAGTSMGALVGAAYAGGMSSAEIEDVVTAIDWSETFGTAGTRDLQPVDLKTGNLTYSNPLEFGLKNKTLLVPAGLVQSQQIESLLRSIVSRFRRQASFDDLPIPFRAIATNIQSGDRVVLDRGDLSVAMRASMAVPGAFSPVTLNGQVLVDGSLVRNLPVDTAREMCADVVIASSLVNTMPEASALQSAFTVLGRMVEVMIKNNEREQLETLGSADVPILISLPDMTSAEFVKVPGAIPRGEAAARALASKLARYSLSAEDYARWRAGLRFAAGEGKPAIVRDIRIEGLSRANPEVVRRQIQSRIGEPVDEARVITDAQRIFARGDFEKVDYRIADSPDGAVLEFFPVEKPWGPDYVRFDLGLMSSSGGDTGFILRADHSRTWINSLGGRWNNAVQVGRTALVETSVFQPLDLRQRFFVEPGLHVSRELEDLFRGDDRVARYERTSLDATLDAGVSLGTVAELRGGLRRTRTDFEATTGSLLLPEFNNVDAAGVTSRFIYDSRDSPFVPTRGAYAHIEFFSAESALGSDDAYRRAEFFAQRVVPFGRNLTYLELGGGSDFDGGAPAYDLFTLGGIGQLAGFQLDELRGHEYAYGRLAQLWKVTDLRALFGQALYAGMSVEAGNMFERIDGAPAQGPIFGSSLFFGGRTPLGPLLLMFGFAEGGQMSAYIQIGRPLKER